mgnify:CR=1 FL=1
MSEAAAGDVWTIARLLGWTRQFLEQRGIESPRLCAEILLAHALGCSRLDLFTRYESAPAAAQLAAFRELVRLAGTGQPIAYLTGRREFFSLAFEVTPDVLIPRPETEVLVERTIDLLRRLELAEARVLDVCTGSGCVGLSLAWRLPRASVCASDISEAALAVARRNAQRLGLEQRVTFAAGDLLAPWSGRQFDVIVCNPPYIGLDEAAELAPGVRDFEPHVALFAGADGLDLLRRLATETPAVLAPGGHLLTEVGYRQAPAVRDLLDAAGWADIVTYKDDLRHERVVHARRAAPEE